ncbi:von Willebrand factor [Planctomycetes bacterium Pan216]|uniref:von Willebrand factor n=1 Tax=Kolteria novifilia TaxID=2527975 RepID=A0A518AY76_9BACT|nr:von Willebrand factor [Planctomycetes bacterium Pan216]
MSLHHDDPRLTAYALGELSETDRAEVEAYLSSDEEARRLVEETKELATMLGKELAQEPTPSLSSEQREEIARQAENPASAPTPTPGPTPSRNGRKWIIPLSFAAAACLLVAVMFPALQGPVRMARQDAVEESLVEAEPAPGSGESPAVAWEEANEAKWGRDRSGQAAQPEGDRKLAYSAPPGSGHFSRGSRPRSDRILSELSSVDTRRHGPPRNQLASEPLVGNDKSDGIKRRYMGSGPLADKTTTTRGDGGSLVLHERMPPASGGGIGGGGIVMDESVASGVNRRMVEKTPAPSKVQTRSNRGSVQLFEIDEEGRQLKRQQSAQGLANSAGAMAGKKVNLLVEPQIAKSQTDFDAIKVGRAAKRPSAPAPSNQVDHYRYKGGINAEKESLAKKSEMAARGLAAEDDRLRRKRDASAELGRKRFAGTEQDLKRESKIEDGFGLIPEKEIRERAMALPDVHPLEPQQPREKFNREAYDFVKDNPFLAVGENPLSTFSIDVDTASYSNIRRFLSHGQRPPKDAVRIEELVNYFRFDDAPPKNDVPFACRCEVASTPWKPDHRLVRIGLKGKEVSEAERPATNLVFLLDVSGSMRPSNKLPLVKAAMTLLVDKLREIDRVAIVVYAGASGLVLPSTSGDHKETIIAALDRLNAGGSTNGGSGIELAYKTAREHFIKDGVNRVILCTDGDFNVGTTNRGELVRLIEKEAKSNVFLSILGFGMGNLQDATLEQLADKGNGNYGYVDSLKEARKLLVEQIGGTLVTIAKDVKIQIEFNPAQVAAYRLIGYENRILEAEDFNDDTKDAGEIGAGHSVTALYEIIPAGQPVPLAKVDRLKYQTKSKVTEQAKLSREMLTVKLRYKAPDGDTSKLIEQSLTDPGHGYEGATGDFKFASAVAAFGMLLRDSPYKGNATFQLARRLAEEGIGADKGGYRKGFLKLIDQASALPQPTPTSPPTRAPQPPTPRER